MSDATDPKFWEEFWGWLLLGPLAGLAVLLKRAKAFGKPDYEEMAKAFFAEKAVEDGKHREALLGGLRDLKRAIEQGFGESNSNTLRVNTATSENMRQVLAMYGKDVTEIRSAIERMDSRVDGLASDVAVLIDRGGRTGK
jgi:hypothetical protein